MSPIPQDEYYEADLGQWDAGRTAYLQATNARDALKQAKDLLRSDEIVVEIRVVHKERGKAKRCTLVYDYMNGFLEDVLSR